MKTILKFALATSALTMAGQANAAHFVINLTGDVNNFSNSQIPFGGLLFNSYSLDLDGFGAPVSVSQGDTISSTITLNQVYTIAASQVRTDLLQFFFGTGFSGAGTGVDGTLDFFDGATLVHSVGYGSSTAGALASFGILFPPNNGAFNFDSVVNNLTINTLDQPATLHNSRFNYSLVSNLNAVPEPASWAMMIAGFGAVGAAARRQAKVRVTYA
jgi:hypothetical protein